MKQNCWEYTNCGREPGGNKVAELGICNAAIEQKLDGIHNGKNAGRSCWVITGTLCGGETQGKYTEKVKNCMSCDFYKTIFKNEYKTGYKYSRELLEILNANSD